VILAAWLGLPPTLGVEVEHHRGVVTVPELVAPGDLADAVAWRERRRYARRASPGLPLTIALATDGADATTAAVLREAGVEVVGLLAPDPLESLAWAAEADAPRAYAEFSALLSDQVEALCVELDPPASYIVARLASEAGLHVLLARPRTADTDAMQAVAEAAEEADLAHVVALESRAWPAAWHAQANAPSLGGLRQVTVLGAPGGERGRTEVVDLAARWAGDVVAVCADRAAMPAEQLAPQAPVTLALLTATGTTVLVNEAPGGRLDTAAITLVGSRARVVVAGGTVRRQGPEGLREWSLSLPSGRRPGLAEAAYDLLRAAELDEVGLARGATFHDLLAAAKVMEAAEESEAEGGWVEL
jgi:predicted dehydrogenase